MYVYILVALCLCVCECWYVSILSFSVQSVVCECSGAVSRTMLGLLVMSAAVAMTAAQLQQLKKQNRPPVSAPSRLHCLTPESSLSPRTCSEF